MNKYIAIAIGVAVVLGTFRETLFPNFSIFPMLGLSEIPTLAPVSVTTDSEEPEEVFIPISDPRKAVLDEAWGVFDRYVELAKKRDLDGVRNLSYKLSSACNDPTQREQCNVMMNSAVIFGESLNKSDFKNVYYDSKQVLLETNTGGDGTRLGLAFARVSGSLKVLGAKWCAPSSPNQEDSCLNANLSSRDMNNNGWWDDLEVFLTH